MIAMNDKAKKIRLAARNLVDKYGGEALERAKRRAEAMREAGYPTANATWLRICSEIDDLIEDDAD